MKLMNEIGSALRITGRVALQGRFWAALLGQPMNLAVVLMAALSAGVGMQAGSLSLRSGGALISLVTSAGLLVLISLMLVPLMMRAWCPVASRFAAAEMQPALPEVRQPSLAVFFGDWLIAVIQLLIVLVPMFVMPKSISWIMLLPAALFISGYQLRCALCLHASAAQVNAVLASTWLRRSLAWVPLCALPYLVFGKLESELGGMLAGVALSLIVLPLWAALSLQALAASPAGTARPAPASPA